MEPCPHYTQQSPATSIPRNPEVTCTSNLLYAINPTGEVWRMTGKASRWRGSFALLLVGVCAARLAYATDEPMGTDLVKRALAAELSNTQNAQHPVRYRLRKASSRLSTTKEIFETKDGAVARLVAINDQPLSPADEQREQARLNGLLSDPSRQRHRKQAEEEDTDRVLKVIRALPTAFIYRYFSSGTGPTGKVEKFFFRPNPDFHPLDLETEVLTEMTGEIWVDPVECRVVRLEGHLRDDVNFGWGVLGRLNKGGWIVIEQANVGNHQWRIAHFQMVMSGRVLFKTRSFDTVEDESEYAPVPAGLGYAHAIQLLRGDPSKSEQAGKQSPLQ